MKAEAGAVRFCCLAVAVSVYAALGSPTPDHPGFSEALIAVLLLAAAALPGIYNVFGGSHAVPLWVSAARALLIYGLTMPLAAAVLRGADGWHILRDIIPLLFMTLPLFTYDIFEGRPGYRKYFLFLVVFAGLSFALRALPETIGLWRPALYDAEPHYYSNAPSVLYAALLLGGTGAKYFIERFSLRAFLFFILCAAVTLLPLLVMTLTLQRASIAMFAGGMGLLALAGLYYYPQKTVFILLAVMAALIPLQGFITDLFEILARKTMLVGLNMRSEEMAAAWRQISQQPGTLFFGAGWGAMFDSPAVSGIRVNYTHSLLSAMLLKTGLLGLVLTCTYIIGVASVLWASWRKNIIMALAVGLPLAIDVFFYASYKSLDFGFILLLAVLAAPVLKVAIGGRVLYSNPDARMSAP